MSPAPRLGLALGGGSARGFAHIGVLQVLVEEGIPIDFIAGTSIGSVVGGLHAAGTLADHTERLLGYKMAKIFALFSPTISRKGLFHGKKIVATLREMTGRAKIDDLDMPFAAVATDADTGEEVRISDGDLVDAMRASFAIPGVFSPHLWNGRWLVDGGVVSPIPVCATRDLGADYVVAVNLINRADEHVVDTASDPAHTAGPAPRMVRAVVQSFNWMQARLAELQMSAHPPDLIIEPPIGKFGLFDYMRGTELIEIGRESTRAVLPQIRAALSAREPA